MNIRPILLCAALAFAAAAPAAPLDDLAKWLSGPASARPAIAAQAFAQASLSKAEAAQALNLLRADRLTRVKLASQAEWQASAFKYNAFTMKFMYRTFGAKPADGRSLFISMHGGGGTTADVNDEQWQNQIGLYRPSEGIYLAPRAPTDDWDLWHQRQIDPLFDRIIEACVAYLDVNPDKVYLMGYSAGGDGVYQLAPRMADRWAAASMMAGHPNDASPLNLRNIGFAIHVGALDSGYGRNQKAQEWKGMLDSLAKADPGGYVHAVQLHAGLAHWMNLEDSVAVPWMMKFRRDPFPKKVVWRQDDVTHNRLYWLYEPSAIPGSTVRAEIQGGTVSVTEADVPKLDILLGDSLVDLDADVTVMWLGKKIFQGRLKRTIQNLWETLEQSGDARRALPARLSVADGVAGIRPRAPAAPRLQGGGRAPAVILFGRGRDAGGRKRVP